MEDAMIREISNRHWAAFDANDLEGEHEIYQEDAVLEYLQSGERVRGRQNIELSRTARPNRKRFKVRRITGASGLWVTEYVLTYDGRPSYTVSIMEFLDGKVPARPNILEIRSSRALRPWSGSSECLELEPR